MDGQKTDSKIIKAVTNEWALFAYRLVTGIGAVVCSALVTAGLAMLTTMQHDIVDLKVNAATTLGQINGKVDVVNNRIDAISARVTRVDQRVDKLSDDITTLKIKVQ